MFECYFDGSCEPLNPGGTMACGMVIFDNDKILWQYGRIVSPKNSDQSQSTNNCAEYAGLWLLLQELIRRSLNESEILIMGDSQLVINQVWGTWKMNNGAYIGLAIKCKDLLKQFKNIKGKWIPRDDNSLADSLSKSALEKLGIKSKKWK